MTQAKYFQKLKCENLGKFPNWHTNPKGFYKCDKCDNSGIIAGADITETIKPILEGNEKFKVVFRYCSECKTYRLLEPDCNHEYFYKHKIEFVELEKAKQIIEENTIKVE